MVTDRTPPGHEPSGDSVDPQIALVTGGGRGIGLEVARQLSAQGFHVLLAARDIDAARQAAAEVGATAVQLDVTCGDDVASVAGVVEDLVRLDVLINNAGTVPDFDQTVLSADLDAAETAWRTNVLGPWRLIQRLRPWLLRSPNPRIVNVAAASGSHGDERIGLGVQPADRAAYTISKAALAALTHKLSVEVPQARVNAVDPGQTASDQDDVPEGFRTVVQGAASVVWAATIPTDGPTGAFLRDGRAVPW